MFPSSTGHMLTSFGFSFIDLINILYIPLERLVIFLESPVVAVNL